MSYKKIIPMVMALGMFTFGGLSCTKDPQEKPIGPIYLGVPVEEYSQPPKKGNVELRKQIFRYLDSNPYSINTDKHEITVCEDGVILSSFMPDPALVVTIKNKSTKDTLKLWDYDIDGDVDEAEYNGISNGTEGMEERFDKALELIRSGLEQKVKKAQEDKQSLVNKVKDNTKLE